MYEKGKKGEQRERRERRMGVRTSAVPKEGGSSRTKGRERVGEGREEKGGRERTRLRHPGPLFEVRVQVLVSVLLPRDEIDVEGEYVRRGVR